MKDFTAGKAVVTVMEFDGVAPMIVVRRAGGATIEAARDLQQALAQAIAAAEVLEKTDG